MGNSKAHIALKPFLLAMFNILSISFCEKHGSSNAQNKVIAKINFFIFAQTPVSALCSPCLCQSVCRRYTRCPACTRRTH